MAEGAWGRLTLRTVPGDSTEGQDYSSNDERWWLLQGCVEVTFGNGGQRVVRQFAQDAILWVRAGTWHQTRNAGPDEVVFVVWSEGEGKES